MGGPDCVVFEEGEVREKNYAGEKQVHKGVKEKGATVQVHSFFYKAGGYVCE